MGAVGLQVLSGVNQRTDELNKLQRKIEAYRQVQHDMTSQLYSVSSAFLSSDELTLSSTLRQLNQFGTTLIDCSSWPRTRSSCSIGFDRIMIGSRIRDSGRGIDPRRPHCRGAASCSWHRRHRLADRLERLTNQLVNKAEADMVTGIEASIQAYATSQWIVVGFALGSIVLALILGYAISGSLIGPVTEVESRLNQIAAGDFSQRVDVVNRDELGALAANVNRMSRGIGAALSAARGSEPRQVTLSCGGKPRSAATPACLEPVRHATAQ